MNTSAGDAFDADENTVDVALHSNVVEDHRWFVLRDYSGEHQYRSQYHLDSTDCCPDGSN